MADRVQMFDNVDSSRRAVQCRPSMSPPVRGGDAFVCANVAYDVPVLAVVIRRDERRCRTMSTRRGAQWRAVQCRPSTSLLVHGGAAVVCAKVAHDVAVLAVIVWWDARRCRTMSTRRGARCTIDHRCRCPCTVAAPPCAPRLPMMYQCSLWWNGGPRADFGQCRLVEARGAVSTVDLAARARWRRRRVRQGCPRCTSARCYCLVGRAQMLVNTDSSRRATQCRLAISPSVCAGSAERLKCMIAHMDASNETI
jgi:hypothetical protein